MSVSTLSKKLVVARKSHRCVWCGCPVITGSQYERQEIIIDGSFQSNAWHEACLTGFDQYYHETREEEFEPGEHEMPFQALYELEARTVLPETNVGWKLVPEVPSEEMMSAGLYQSSHDAEYSDVAQSYMDMVKAAPEPPADQVGGTITDPNNSVKPVDPEDEAYEIGKRDGYSEAVQQIDQLTGGDGEYRYCTDHDPDRHTPGPAEIIQRIVDRFEVLNLLDDATKTGRDQPDDAPAVHLWAGPETSPELYRTVHDAAIAVYEASTPADYRYSASALRQAVDAGIRAALAASEGGDHG